jgi:hypothetical protein
MAATVHNGLTQITMKNITGNNVAGWAKPNPEPKNTNYLRTVMNTKRYLLILFLTLSAGLLMWPSRAAANNIVVDSETLWSTITVGSGPGGAPSTSDNIQIINGARLWVDVPQANCLNLTIGNGGTAGTLQFDTLAVRTLTVAGLLDWGGTAGNQFIMSGVSVRQSITVIQGTVVFPDGTGFFNPGLGVMQYALAGDQTVASLAYKDLDLIGSGHKTISGGTLVNGQLFIGGTATLQGNPVSYGSLASLKYGASQQQTSSPLEFPSGMTKFVDVANVGGLILDGSKVISGPFAIESGSFLDVQGNTLICTGNVTNNGTAIGAGAIQLAGVNQAIVVGPSFLGFGNVIVTASNTVPAGFQVNGRLTIQVPAVLNLSGTSVANWLSIGNPLVHQPPGTYSANNAPTAFSGPGTLTVNFDLVPTFSNLNPSPTAQLIYGSTSITLSGQISGSMISGQNYGTVYPANGETVTVTIKQGSLAGPVLLTTNTTTFGGNGSFVFNNLAVGSLPVGTSDPIIYSYAGGNNLAAAPNDTSTTLSVVGRPITVTAQSSSKVYGDPDSAVAYTVTPALLPGDNFSVSPVTYPASGVTAPIGAYNITANPGVQITNATGIVTANYQVTVIGGPTFTVIARPVIIQAVPTGKTYNGNQADPTLTFNAVTNIYSYINGNPVVQSQVTVLWPNATNALVNGDTLAGSLSRAAGIHQGTYAITRGSVAPSGNANNYAVTFQGATFTIAKTNIAITPIPSTQSPLVNGKTYGTYPGGASSPQRDGVITYQSVPDPTTWGDRFVGFLLRSPTNEAVNPLGYPIVRNNLWVTNDAAGSAGTTPSGGTTNDYVYQFDTTKTFIIYPATLTITAVDKSVTYGTAPPSPIVYTGLANGDTTTHPAPTFTSTAVAGSPAGTYPNNYTIVQAATMDPNYSITYPSPQTSNLTVTKKGLSISANSKTKPADGTPYTPFDVSYNGFIPGDNSFLLTGSLSFGGSAITSTLPGTYLIVPSGQTSSNYNVSYNNGLLTLTAPIATVTTNISQVWDGTTMLNFQIRKGIGGVAGTDWSLINITGAAGLTINPGTVINVTTVLSDGVTPGLMAKFDPTRSNKWVFATSVTPILGSAANITLVTVTNGSTAGLFANPTFGGTFSASTDPNNVYINYTPYDLTQINQSQSGSGNPPASTVSGNNVIGATNDTSKVLGGTFASDLPVLYLQVIPTNYPGSGPITQSTPVWFTPGQPVTVYLNVGNLSKGIGTNVVGVQAYIAYSSANFVNATPNSSTPGAPQVTTVPGSDWGQLISTIQPVAGELDVVLGVKLTLTAGTAADGNIAKIVLTPRKTTTTNSRVAFLADGLGGLGTGTNFFTDINGATQLPCKVPTEQINIINDGTAPLIPVFTATEAQPHKAATPTLSNNSGTVTVTNSANPAVRGTVQFLVQASDPGTGLSGQPTIQLTGPATVNLVSTDSVPPIGVTGTFNYNWVVDGNTSPGTYTATVTATDLKGNSGTRPLTIIVNINQISGVVQLDPFTPPTAGFAGTNRWVQFVAGPAGNHFTNFLNLVFTSSNFVAGAFSDRQAYAQEVQVPTQPVSSWFHFGDISTLNSFYNKFMSQSSLGLYLQSLEFGAINGLSDLANVLNNPQRAVDFYIKGRLSTSTLNALSAYLANPNSQNAAILTTDLLDDFTIIINGPNIYNPVTFNGIAFTQPYTNPPPATFEQYYLSLTTPSAWQMATLNRILIFDAYPTNFIAGVLNPQTPYQLLTYAGGPDTTPANNTLKTNLLVDLNTIEGFPTNIYTPARFFGIVLRPITQTNLLANLPGQVNVTTLNRELLEDAFVFTPYPNYNPNYDSGPLSAQTLLNVTAYLTNTSFAPSITNFDTGMINDLNSNLVNGPLIYTVQNSNRWNFCYGNFAPETLASLPPNPPPTGANLAHVNHQILEAAFTLASGKMLLVGSQYATYTLQGIPNSTTAISAKAMVSNGGTSSYSLQRSVTSIILAPGVTTGAATANFVTSGVYPATTGAYNTSAAPTGDFYLRGGDLNGDNTVNLVDYNILVGNQGPNKPAGDINGDGISSSFDYNIMVNNYQKTGDPNIP